MLAVLLSLALAQSSFTTAEIPGRPDTRTVLTVHHPSDAAVAEARVGNAHAEDAILRRDRGELLLATLSLHHAIRAWTRAAEIAREDPYGRALVDDLEILVARNHQQLEIPHEYWSLLVYQTPAERETPPHLKRIRTELARAKLPTCGFDEADAAELAATLDDPEPHPTALIAALAVVESCPIATPL